MKRIVILTLCVALLFSTVVLADINFNTHVNEMCTIQSETDVPVNLTKADINKLIEIGKQLQKEAIAGSKSSTYYYPDKYFQNVEPWKDYEMETCGETIGEKGCALTSFTMLASLHNSTDDPGDVNVTMGDDACDFDWIAGEINYNLEQYHYGNSTLDEEDAEYAIAGILEDDVCVVGMTYSGGTHYVLARAYYMTLNEVGIYIYDPASRDYSKLQDYFDDGYVVNRLIYYLD